MQPTSSSIDLFLVLLYGIVLAALAIIDRQRGVLPNILIFPTTAVALVAGSWAAVWAAAIALVFFAGLYYLGQYYFGPGAMGMGDVKLAMLLGAILGFPFVFHALAIGMLFAGAAAIAVIARRPQSQSLSLPYGLYLSVGGLIVLAWMVIG